MLFLIYEMRIVNWMNTFISGGNEDGKRDCSGLSPKTKNLP